MVRNPVIAQATYARRLGVLVSNPYEQLLVKAQTPYARRPCLPGSNHREHHLLVKAQAPYAKILGFLGLNPH